MPLIRKGHTLTSFKNKIILFGGFHDLTHELDDLYYFDFFTLTWILVDKETENKIREEN